MTVTDHSISQEDFDLFRCDSCRFTFTQDIPDQEHIGNYYKGADYISHSDSRKGLVNKLYHRARSIMLDRKYKLIKKYTPGRRHLDYGTGTGYFLQYMKKRGYQVSGVEIDAETRTYAQQLFGLEIDTPDNLLADTRRQIYDSISMWHVLEHIEQPHRLLSQMHRLLDDEGYLFVAVPNHVSTDGKKYKEHWAGYDVPRHLWHFEPDTMQKMAQKNGFTVVAKQSMPFDPYYNSLLSERYRKAALSLVRGGLTGLVNTFASLGNTDRSSSLIYILKKQ